MINMWLWILYWYFSVQLYCYKKSRDYCFSVVTVNDEHRNSSVGVKSKEGSGLKATVIFVILLCQDGFESDSPERKS